ncbi:MAG: transcription termination factor Rho [Verrucomicrobia bacterium]|nr:transcription termination factor Rho [Verrucomicrobiota bacterium]
MAEANEQPALLNQDVDDIKKPRRSKTAARPRGSTASKTGARRAKKPTKGNEQTAESKANNHLTLLEAPEGAPSSDVANEEGIASAQPRGLVEPAELSNDSTSAELSQPVEESVPAVPVASRFHEAPPSVEAPRYDPVFGEGLIEVSGKGFGFLRDPKRNYVQSPQDIFVTPEVVRKHALRDGLWIKGEVRRGSRGPQLFKLLLINGEDPEKYRNLPVFEELTSINPLERIRLETVPDRYTTRVMDLMTPIGKGQRGLIVAPPRTGKTTLLQHIADAVVRNHAEVKLIILLVDERPEEVTEIRRTVPKADIMASSNDSDIKSHTRIAQLAIERAKRLVEAGKDVFVLMDSLTRVGRAFNNAISGSGRTMSGGMDSRAMEIPRKLFAAARNTEEAGSLTIMATALIETGSKMDELIFQEFKGTGNMEMVLDRQISDQRIYPAIDIFKSGTRREELLIPVHDLEKINTIRRGLAGHRPPEAIERLLSFLKKFPTNSQMLREIPG